MEKLQKKVQQALQGYSVMQSIPRITAHSCSKGSIWLVQDKLGMEGQQRRAQTKLHRLWLPTHMRALHAYACYSTATTPLLHSSLTYPRICVAFYAYAYHLIHHPAQPPFYTKATLPTHMRALYAYACYHNTQHHHNPSCLTYLHTKATSPCICVTFYAYAWHHPYPPPLNQNHPLITHAYASILTHMRGTLNKSHFALPHSPSPLYHYNISPIHNHFNQPPTHMRRSLHICVEHFP
ncbi:hypothetical protein PIB30_104727 [Stylosanthes scabra]|uniref:Uncharacterized protein n=1 Tax=Stylosanthes scabra TaxID=79078 RepID=A0ABU6XVD1_9FABA|nr:hypothetical protein [Stylosanthes scabra]